MSPIELLKRAKALISNPDRWTRGTWARDENGISTPADVSEAYRWCAVGALIHEMNVFETRDAALDALDRAAVELGYLYTTDCNDYGPGTTQCYRFSERELGDFLSVRGSVPAEGQQEMAGVAEASKSPRRSA